MQKWTNYVPAIHEEELNAYASFFIFISYAIYIPEEKIWHLAKGHERNHIQVLLSYILILLNNMIN